MRTVKHKVKTFSCMNICLTEQEGKELCPDLGNNGKILLEYFDNESVSETFPNDVMVRV